MAKKETNMAQENTNQRENIGPPHRIGDRWRKAHKSKTSISKIIREIKRPFLHLYAPVDIIFRRSKKLKQAEKEFPTVLSLKETVDLMIGGASICRFGDAEFGCLQWQYTADQHSPEWAISHRLEKVLMTPSSEQLIVAIPPWNPKHNNSPRKYGWLNFWQMYWSIYWEFLREKLMNRTFGNSFVSRDAVFYEVDLERIRAIWAGRNVVFVVGKNSHFFDEPRLFDNMKSVEYLFVEPVHAYRNYETVLRQALTFDKSNLFFISAGYMATALAFDLHHHGYQALDMGHLPNCYREYLKESPRPEWISETIVR